jgi:osmoprotectant transport system permease protein
MDFVVDVGKFFADNPQLMLELTLRHVLLSVTAVVVAIVIALPIGVTIGHLHRWSFLAVNGGNALRALPTLAIVAIGIGLYGLGFFNILLALVILALPLVLTNSYVAVDGVDRGMVEAARGMGLTGWQIVWRVELPNALPLIMAGIRTALVYVIATAYLAGLAGYSGTLGEIITNQSSYRLTGVMAATLVAVVLAFLGEFLLAGLERLITPKGLQHTALIAVI